MSSSSDNHNAQQQQQPPGESSEQALQAAVAALQQQQQQCWQAYSSYSSSSSSSSLGHYLPAVATGRALTAQEIATLQATGCRAKENWNQVRILTTTTTTTPHNNNNINKKNNYVQDVSPWLRQYVSHTTFGPNVFLVLWIGDGNISSSCLAASPSSRLPADIRALPVGCHFNGLIRDCVVDCTTSRCCHNQLVSHTVCGADTALVGCGTVTCTTNATTTNTMQVVELSVGPESGGGRTLRLPAHATMKTVTDQLVGMTPSSSYDTEATEKRQQQQQAPPLNILLPGSYICHTPTIDTVVLHTGACICAATAVVRTTLFPQATIAHAASVTDCILQWKAAVTHHSTLDKVFLMECAAAGPHSFSSHAVLGPDVHISAGEVHASVLGPNTNAHHQSLCIGVLWPHGRGNIGYGANVGSNHTGRLPDQEVAAAEGCFWGLSSVIVMPCNLSHAPYCIVAAGTTLPAQRVALPFCLIQTGTVAPGWVYAKSPYTVVRSAHKYATRRKAQYHAYYTGWNIIRPSVVQLCVAAREGLQQSEEKTSSVLGNLKCNDRGRQLGIQTYTDLIQRYALQELLRLCLEGSPATIVPRVARALSENSMVMPAPIPAVEWAPFPWDEDPTQETAYQRALLVQEFLQGPCSSTPAGVVSKHWIRQGLERLGALETQFTAAVRNSKARDDTRGAVTIPHYAAAHVAADDDPVIVRQNKECQTMQQHIQHVLAHLPASQL
eukprot:scaffold6781_cov204-Amphora_coffeaeformis.AAC.34